MSSIEDLKRDNAQYLFHPMAHPAAMRKDRPDIIARGEGCWIWDVDGHKMLDGVAGLWSSNLGHSNKAVRDAIVAQLDELPFYNTFRGTTHPRAIELSARVVQTMAPDGVAAVMFCNGGSDAVEGALLGRYATGAVTDDPPVAFGKIELRLAMLEPGILARRYEAMDFILQWRDPVRVACVQAVGQVDKRIPVGFGCDRANQG